MIGILIRREPSPKRARQHELPPTSVCCEIVGSGSVVSEEAECAGAQAAECTALAERSILGLVSASRWMGLANPSAISKPT